MQRAYPFLLALAVTVLDAHAQEVPPAGIGLGSHRLFDPSSVKPEKGSALARALAAEQAGDEEAAYRVAHEALAEAPAYEAGLLRWLAARHSPDADTRRSQLEALAESNHPLARWGGLRLAQMLLDADPARAAEIARGLPDGWPGEEPAQRVAAMGLAKSGQPEAAEPRLAALVEKVADHVPAAPLRFALAELLSARDDAEARARAVRLYQAVAARAPFSADARLAERRIEALLDGLPPGKRARLAQETAEDSHARGRALFWARDYETAREVYLALAERMKADAQARCEAELEVGRTLVRQRKRQEAADWFDGFLQRCEDPDMRAWARYYAGRGLYRIGKPEPALALFEALQDETPEHRLADDVQYFAAMVAKDLDEPEIAVERLRTLVARYPQGDMTPPSRFLLAWQAWQEGAYREALRSLDEAIALGPGEDDEGCEGRARYWRARTLAVLGRVEEAIEAYEELALGLPLSYYAQQAVARLRELRPEVAEDVVGRWGAPAAAGEAMLARLARRAVEVALASRERASSSARLPDAAGWQGDGEVAGNAQGLLFPPRPELTQPAFVRALALLRTGDVDLAEQELRSLGALGEGADPDMLWLVASLLDASGDHAAASKLVRSRLPSFRKVVPRGKARAMWRLGYPRAYTPLIERVSEEMEVPAAFVRAVAREESAFDPRAVSSAKAYGLIQLMQATARQHAEQLGLPSDPASLRKPEINLRIGTHFMQFLWQRYADNPAIIPAAYNAGHGAADGWLAARGDLPLDAWVETIPYAETRRYTRRVLQTYGIYAWLDEGRLPALPSRLPRR